MNADFSISVFDQNDIVQRDKVKWYSPWNRSTWKRGIGFHHTGVKGGFGVSKSVRKTYEAEVPDFSRFVRMQQGFSKEEWVRAMGLAQRFLRVPYHVIRASNSVLYLNLPFSWWTWHGNGMNQRFIGFAWDGDSRVERAPENLIEDIEYTVELARKEGHDVREFTCHSAYTRKPNDPGPDFIERILLPAAKLTGCSVDMKFCENGGESMESTLRRIRVA